SQRAGPHSALVTTAMNLGLHPNIRRSSNVKSTNSLRPVHLVSRQRQQINIQAGNIERQLSSGLRSINVKKHTTLSKHRTDGLDVGDTTQFVVNHHQTDQNGIVLERFRDGFRRNPAIGLRSQPGDVNPLLFQPFTGINYRLVLNQRGHNVWTRVDINDTFYGQVIRFCGTGSPDNFSWIGMNEFGYLTASVFYGSFGLPSITVGARCRVAKNTV